MINIAIGSIILAGVWIYMGMLAKRAYDRMAINALTLQLSNKLYANYALPFVFTKSAKFIMASYTRAKLENISGYILMALSLWPVLALNGIVQPLDTFTSMVICALIATWITKMHAADLTPREVYWNAVLTIIHLKRERASLIRRMEQAKNDDAVTESERQNMADTLTYYDRRINANTNVMHEMEEVYDPSEDANDSDNSGGFGGMTPT